MTQAPGDPRWPKLLSLSVHEFRTPMTVVAGYIRMLLKDRAGPVTDQQRRLLEEAEKSCARLSALLAEMSELGNLEGGTATFNRAPIDLRALLTDTVASLPPLPDREIAVTLQGGDGAIPITGDAVRLKSAFTSIINALRRELVTENAIVVRAMIREQDGRRIARIAIGDVDRVDAGAAAEVSTLTPFDEWRGGVGLSLAIARRVINAHGGRAWSPADGAKAAAVVELPVEA